MAPERLVLLGDILYHGPRNDLPRDYDTKAVTSMLNALKPAPLCIRGNCDGEVDQMVLLFPALAYMYSGPFFSVTITFVLPAPSTEPIMSSSCRSSRRPGIWRV